jgi:citrate lyase alpha subunit
MAQCITLETRAINDRSLYQKPDVYGRVPEGNKMIASNDSNKCEKPLDNESHECIGSEINLSNVCHKVNQHFQNGLIKMPAVMSSNAGRFEIII